MCWSDHSVLVSASGVRICWSDHGVLVSASGVRICWSDHSVLVSACLWGASVVASSPLITSCPRRSDPSDTALVSEEWKSDSDSIPAIPFTKVLSVPFPSFCGAPLLGSVFSDKALEPSVCFNNLSSSPSTSSWDIGAVFSESGCGCGSISIPVSGAVVPLASTMSFSGSFICSSVTSIHLASESILPLINLLLSIDTSTRSEPITTSPYSLLSDSILCFSSVNIVVVNPLISNSLPSSDEFDWLDNCLFILCSASSCSLCFDSDSGIDSDVSERLCSLSESEFSGVMSSGASPGMTIPEVSFTNPGSAMMPSRLLRRMSGVWSCSVWPDPAAIPDSRDSICDSLSMSNSESSGLLATLITSSVVVVSASSIWSKASVPASIYSSSVVVASASSLSSEASVPASIDSNSGISAWYSNASLASVIEDVKSSLKSLSPSSSEFDLESHPPCASWTSVSSGLMETPSSSDSSAGLKSSNSSLCSSSASSLNGSAFRGLCSSTLWSMAILVTSLAPSMVSCAFALISCVYCPTISRSSSHISEMARVVSVTMTGSAASGESCSITAVSSLHVLSSFSPSP